MIRLEGAACCWHNGSGLKQVPLRFCAKEEQMIFRIQNQEMSASISDRGAELKELSLHGHPFLWNGDPAYWKSTAPVLFPYVGRLTRETYRLDGNEYHMGIHGFARSAPFHAEMSGEQAVTFRLEDTEETRRQYPFSFRFEVTYALEGETLSITYTVVDRSERIMPFGIGGHPGFRVPLDEGLHFDDYMLTFGEPCLPDRVIYTDSCFVGAGREPYPLADGRNLPLTHQLFDQDAVVLANTARSVTLHSGKGSRSVTVDFPDFPYLGIWHTPRKNAPFVAIEPWSSLSARQDVEEDLNCQSDLIRLPSGASFRNQWQITLKD